MFRKLVVEARRALAEDPNNFFMPVPPQEGRRKVATTQLMGTERPEEDDEIANGDEPTDDFERTLRDPRYRRDREVAAGNNLGKVVGPGDVSR